MVLSAEYFLTVLDIARDATDDEVRAAYREAVFVWHPDRLPERMQASATKRLAAINEAYAYLMGPEGRLARSAGDEDEEADDGDAEETRSPEVVETTCRRCKGTGSTIASVTPEGRFESHDCPLCMGRATLVCVAGSACTTCEGDGKGPDGRAQSRAAFLRANMIGVAPGTTLYRLRFRRLVLHYENNLAPCKTCRGAGFTFFKPDARLGPSGPFAAPAASKGARPPRDRRRSETRAA